MTFVAEKGPAYAAGMRAGDGVETLTSFLFQITPAAVIVRVNGVDVTTFTATEVVEQIRRADRPCKIDILRQESSPEPYSSFILLLREEECVCVGCF